MISQLLRNKHVLSKFLWKKNAKKRDWKSTTILPFNIIEIWLGTVAHACNPSYPKAEVEESLEPGRQRRQSVKIMPRHSSLGDRVRFHLNRSNIISYPGDSDAGLNLNTICPAGPDWEILGKSKKIQCQYEVTFANAGKARTSLNIPPATELTWSRW